MITEKNNVFYCDCGFSWRRGMSGSHNCEDRLRAKLTDMAVQLANAESKCRELAAENAALKESEREFNEYCRQECESAGDTWVDDFTETPATDTFLAEVRAQGVDASIEHLSKKFEGAGHIGVPVMALEWLAQEIRKGAAL
nr:hypothetical protein [Salmonella enterica]